MAKTQTTEANAAAFTKAQLVASQRYVHRRDLIGALLEDGKTYTLNEVDQGPVELGAALHSALAQELAHRPLR